MTRASTFGYLIGGVLCTTIASMGAVDPCLGKGGSCSYVGFYKVLFGVLSTAGYVGAIMESHQTEEDELEEFREKLLSFQSRGAISELYAQKAIEVAEVMAEEHAMTAAGIPLELPASIPQTQYQPVASTVQAQAVQSAEAVQAAGLIPSPANSLAIQNSTPTPMNLATPTPTSSPPILVTLPDGAKLIEATALENIDEYPVVMVIAGMGSGKTQTMRWIFSRLSGTKVFSSHKAEIQDLQKFDLCFGYCPQTGKSRWIGDQNGTVTTLDRDLTWIKNNRGGVGTISEFYWGVFAEITNRQTLGNTKVKALEKYIAFSDETSFAFSVAYNDPLNNDSLKWGQSLVAGSNKATFMDARSNKVQIYYAAQGEAVETIGLKNMATMRDGAWHLYPGREAIMAAKKHNKHQLAQWFQSRLDMGYAIALIEKGGVFFHVLNLPLISELENTPDLRTVAPFQPAPYVQPAPLIQPVPPFSFDDQPEPDDEPEPINTYDLIASQGRV